MVDRILIPEALTRERVEVFEDQISTLTDRESRGFLHTFYVGVMDALFFSTREQIERAAQVFDNYSDFSGQAAKLRRVNGMRNFREQVEIADALIEEGDVDGVQAIYEPFLGIPGRYNRANIGKSYERQIGDAMKVAATNETLKLMLQGLEERVNEGDYENAQTIANIMADSYLDNEYHEKVGWRPADRIFELTEKYEELGLEKQFLTSLGKLLELRSAEDGENPTPAATWVDMVSHSAKYGLVDMMEMFEGRTYRAVIEGDGILFREPKNKLEINGRIMDLRGKGFTRYTLATSGEYGDRLEGEPLFETEVDGNRIAIHEVDSIAEQVTYYLEFFANSMVWSIGQGYKNGTEEEKERGVVTMVGYADQFLGWLVNNRQVHKTVTRQRVRSIRDSIQTAIELGGSEMLKDAYETRMSEALGQGGSIYYLHAS